MNCNKILKFVLIGIIFYTCYYIITSINFEYFNISGHAIDKKIYVICSTPQQSWNLGDDSFQDDVMVKLGILQSREYNIVNAYDFKDSITTEVLLKEVYQNENPDIPHWNMIFESINYMELEEYIKKHNPIDLNKLVDNKGRRERGHSTVLTEAGLDRSDDIILKESPKYYSSILKQIFIILNITSEGNKEMQFRLGDTYYSMLKLKADIHSYIKEKNVPKKAFMKDKLKMIADVGRKDYKNKKILPLPRPKSVRDELIQIKKLAISHEESDALEYIQLYIDNLILISRFIIQNTLWWLMYSAMVYNGIRVAIASQCATRGHNSQINNNEAKCPVNVIAVSIEGGLISQVEKYSMPIKVVQIKNTLKKNSRKYGYSQLDVDNLQINHEHYNSVDDFAKKNFNIDYKMLKEYIRDEHFIEEIPKLPMHFYQDKRESGRVRTESRGVRTGRTGAKTARGAVRIARKVRS